MTQVYIETVDSTNKYAKEHIEEISDRSVVYTYNQTAGRGRLDRKWNFTGGDNIYATLVLKPSCDMREVYSNLTQYLCVVIAELMEEYGVEPSIKWPNDVQVGSKKISGILAEGVIERNCLRGLILGFGINLNAESEVLAQINQPATALNIELGQYVDKEIFLKRLLEKFFLRYDRFIEDGFSLIKNDYLRRVRFLNQEIKVRVFDKEISGIAKEITEGGALVLLDKNNQEHLLMVGDIINQRG